MGTSMERRVAAFRRFSRFYTREIGVLDTPLPLAQIRVLYELGHRDRPTAAELSRDLGIDPGYLSRILRQFEERGLLRREPAPEDGRQNLLILTEAGAAELAPLEARSRADIAALLSRLAAADQERVIAAMETIENLLGAPPERRPPYLLRPHQPGDMGWVVRAHGLLYAREYRFDDTFEALVAEIVAQFIKNFDPRRERCWIAERDGENVGSIFLVRASDEVAKLRLLIVDPSARGLGIGGRLVDECVRFARQAGYARITLWTNSVLVSARRIYEHAGFKLVASEPHHSFGHDLVGETWELQL
jgi:DNA-binding MarR family transcriptional regulator/GNAT superfamily N-acetyltransferase